MAGRGEQRMVGIVAHGGDASLEALGLPPDAGLTPFGASYRLVDLALATLANSGVRIAGVPRVPAGRGPRPVAPPVRGGRAARVLEALRRLASESRRGGAAAIVVLSADHVLQLDLRDVHAFHRRHDADVTLAGLPVPFGEQAPRTLLRAGRDRRLAGFGGPPADALSWAGDLLVAPRALPTVAALLASDAARDDETLLGRLADELRVVVWDAFDGGIPGSPSAHGAYWHEPTSVEAYYHAQMDLCCPRPGLDLFNPAWPLPTPPRPFGPAKVGVDTEGRAGQALNCLLADGAVIRGALVANSVLGPGAVVEGGAEVEDCILLDGCRIGRHARIRRAVVGAGAVVPDGAEIGFDAAPDWAQERSSGLWLVPPAGGADGRRDAVAR